MSRVVPVLVVTLLTTLLAGAAAAEPLEAGRKGSNNFDFITYDSATATLETTPGGISTRTSERFRMWVSVDADPAAEVGGRLLGTLRLYLRAARAMSFEGVFKLVFLNSETGERTRIETTDSFVLRPRPGARGRRISYVFDLPSGTYQYFGLYKPQAL